MRVLSWLYPGLGVKRWLALVALAALLLGLGVAFSVSPGTMPAIAAAIAHALRKPDGTTVPRWVLALFFLLSGAAMASSGLRGVSLSVARALAPQSAEGLGEALYVRRNAGRGPRLVAIGGGTGLPVLLRGLKAYSGNITAVVTVADDGGSSGRLRGELGVLPPGDVRNCLLALADTEPLMEQVFLHRFSRGDLAGHSVGNLLLSGLSEVTGDFVQAIEAASRILAVRGQVLPSTLEHVVLVAEMEDGREVRGESSITAAGGRIARLRLDPPDPPALEAAVRAVLDADILVIGPGSLYTSILPNLALSGLREALRRTRALRILVVNVMTQPGETDGFSAGDHLAALQAHVGRPGVDLVLVNSRPVGTERLGPYSAQGSSPVAVDAARCQELGVAVLAADVVTRDGLVRHDPDRLARVVLQEALRRLTPAPRQVIDYYYLQERLRRGAQVGGAGR